MPIARVYEYGLLPPTQHHELILDQMRLNHRYRNRLTEIERDRRAAIVKALSSHADVEPIAIEVADLVKQREAVLDEMSRTNANARKKVPQPERKAALRELGAKLREARGRLKEAKTTIREDIEVAAKMQAAEDAGRAAVRSARESCGVYWSTYLLAEASADQARKAPTPPRFLPWTGDGRVAVQLQGGIALAELWGGDTQIAIAPVDPLAHTSPTRGERRRLSRTVLRMRVQSDPKGKPIWAEWPMILHRPLPENCRIKHATVHRRKRDCRTWAWTLTLQVELEDGWTRGAPGVGTVALNLGHCASYPHLAGAIRSGFLVDDQGREREATVARSVIDRVEKSESIRGFRDKNLDVMRPALVEWLRANEAALPAWLVEKTILSRKRDTPLGTTPAHAPGQGAAEGGKGQLGVVAAETASSLVDDRVESDGNVARHDRGRDAAVTGVQAQLGALPAETPGLTETTSAVRTWHVIHWKAAARFRALAFYWRDRRFDGDAAGYDLIEAWRYRDEHLQRYEAGMLRGALLDRREKYRILAADLARTYKTLVVHDTDLREFQKLPAPTSDDVKIPVARRNQRHAAGSILRATLENAFKRSGGEVIIVSDAGITSTCHACGAAQEWDRVHDREHACTECGATWDQDANACKNMLAGATAELERRRTGSMTEGDRTANEVTRKESRSERLRRNRWKKTDGEVARDA